MEAKMGLRSVTDTATVTVDVLGAVIQPGIVSTTAAKKQVSIRNETKDWIEVYVPGKGRTEPIRIEPGATRPVGIDRDPGIHTFVVYSEESGDCARANSNPKIIIQ
jgi:hypothetical protein